MARPTFVCEFSPGSVPLSTSRSWIDISSRVLRAEWTWGAERDGEDFPGEAVLTLDNHDRIFDPENSSGTYFGDLLPRVPFRLRTTGTVTADLFYGFVEDGWEQEFEPPQGGICTVKLVDLLTVLEGYVLPGVLEHAILELDPLHYWPLTSPGCEDLGSGNQPGTPEENPTFGAAELFPGLGPSVEFDGEHQRVDISRSLLNFDWQHASLVVAFSTTLDAEVGTTHPIWVMGDGNNPSVDVASLFVDTDGTLAYEYIEGGTGALVSSADRVDDGIPHLAFAQSNLGEVTGFGIGIDTATLNEDFTSGGVLGASGTAIGGAPFAPRDFSTDHFPGRVSHLAIYDAVLDETGRQSILDASSCLMGLRSDEQVAWALDRIGVPAGMRNLDEGRSIMGAAYTAGADALEFIRAVTATEQGSFYVDHADGGRLRMTQRYTAFEATRSTVSQATFSDDPAQTYANVRRVERDQVVVEANGVRTIVNQATVTWRGGEQTAEDASSITAYGPRGRTIDTEAGNANQALGLAQWVVLLNAEPRTRVRGLGLNPGAAQSGFATALGLRPHDLVTYRSQPASTGSVINRSLLIKGVHHEVEKLRWVTQFFTDSTPADAVTLFTLGTSELDGPDVLAY